VTAVRGVILFCDAQARDGAACAVPSASHAVPEERTVKEARRAAARMGWHYTRKGSDICPDCWDAGCR
jgi:hypothetical protein